MRKNWDVPETFPNTAVIKAYKAAKVDESRDKFTYGRPDLQLLRQFCLDKFGWSQDKADELLVPVLKVENKQLVALLYQSMAAFIPSELLVKYLLVCASTSGIHKHLLPSCTDCWLVLLFRAAVNGQQLKETDMRLVQMKAAGLCSCQDAARTFVVLS